MLWLRNVVSAGVIIVLASVQTRAQTGTAAPAFEVASIRRTDPKSTGPTMRFMPGGRLSVTGMTIKNLIQIAYGIQDYQLSGSPKWLGAESYDIEAKPPAGSPWLQGQRGMDEQRARIRALLADRCQLKVHREARMSPVYALTVAKTGLKMQEAKGAGASAKSKGAILPWSLFVVELSQRLDRPIVDQTGLKGAWYVKLEYASDDGKPAAIGVRIDPDSETGQQWPSIFTALREQLGLQAESAKGPVDRVVIDSVERPSAN
jgi:uncharacterized protein (TIGR03435 family)